MSSSTEASVTATKNDFIHFNTPGHYWIICLKAHDHLALHSGVVACAGTTWMEHGGKSFKFIIKFSVIIGTLISKRFSCVRDDHDPPLDGAPQQRVACAARAQSGGAPAQPSPSPPHAKPACLSSTRWGVSERGCCWSPCSRSLAFLYHRRPGKSSHRAGFPRVFLGVLIPTHTG